MINITIIILNNLKWCMRVLNPNSLETSGESNTWSFNLPTGGKACKTCS